MWSKFEAATNEDETVNNKFCENGLFKIKNDNTEAIGEPLIQAHLQNKRIFVAVENRLFLIEDEGEMVCNFLSFEARVDGLFVSPNGNLAIVALADGNVHGIHIKGVPLFQLTVKAEDIGSKRTFVGIEQEDEVFYLMCTNGIVYRLYNCDDQLLTESLCHGADNETLICNQTLLNNVILERISNKCFENVDCFCLIPINQAVSDNPMDNWMVIYGCGGSLVFISCVEHTAVQLPASYGTVKAIFNLDDYVLCLTTAGRLLELCPYTQMYFSHAFKDQALIEDLLVMESNGEDIELLVLTQLVAGSGRLLRIVEFPTMACKYELTMPDIAWLVHQPKSSVNMYYMSGCTHDSQYIQEIEMKIISETDPFQRMLKLIQRGRLIEAEDYAQQFELSPQPILEAKARKILMDIGSGKFNQKLSEKVESLLVILAEIENKEFFLNIRGMDIPDRNLLARFLKFLLKSIDSTNHPDEVDEINENLLRLGTLKLIDPNECILDWESFVHRKNLLTYCKEIIKTDISVACMIWARHLATILPDFEIKNMIKLLNAIPPTVEPFQIIQWLKHFVPSILQCYPHLMSQLVEWSIQKTRGLQYSEMWPEIGLEFGNKVLQIFTDVHFLLVDVRRQYETNIDKLHSLIIALEDLSVLKRDYNLSITLDDYLKEKIEDTALNLLKRVQLTNLGRMVNNFLYPIFMEKGMSPEPSIIRYVKFLCTNKVISCWQDRAVECVELVNDEEAKLQCVLLILKSAPVPLSDVLNPLLKYGTVSHPLATQIFVEYKSQIIKIIKGKYGWPADYNLNYNDDHMKLMFRIMKLNLPEMLDDIRALIQTTSNIDDRANFYCVYELAKRGQVERAVQVLDSLDTATRIRCCEAAMTIIMEILNESGACEGLENLVELMHVMETRMKGQWVNHSVEQLVRLKVLRHNFKLDVDFFGLGNVNTRLVYLEAGIECIIDGLHLKDTDAYLDSVWWDIQLLCKSLDMDATMGLYKFVQRIGNLHMTCAVVKMLVTTCKVDRNNCEMSLKFVYLMLVQQMMFTNDSGTVDPMAYPLAYKLLLECLNDGVMQSIEIMELIKWTRIGYNLYDHELVEMEIRKTHDEGQWILRQITKTANESLSPDFNNPPAKRHSLSVFEQVHANGGVAVTQKVNDPALVLKLLGAALKLLSVGVLEPIVPPFSRLNEVIDELMVGDRTHQDTSDEFYAAMEQLVKSLNYSIVLTVIQLVVGHQRRSENGAVLIPQMFASKLHQKTLKFLLSQKEPDFMEALIVLLAETNQAECMRYLEDALRNGSQKIAYITLAEMYFTVKGDMERVRVERESRIRYYYYTELCKIDPTLKNKNVECLPIQPLLKELRNKILDVELLKKLSQDFKFNFQYVLANQVLTLLNTQQLEFTVTTDVFGQDAIAVKTSVEEIVAICQPYVNEIENREDLAKELRKFVEKINFYFYELYLAVFEILKHINYFSSELIIQRNMLLFLKNKMTTKRHNRPSQIENDLFLHSQADAGVLPKIAKYRLPFMPLVKEPLQNILDNEVNVDNVERWFPLIKMSAQLINKESQQEYFCMSAVKNSIQERTDDFKGDVWNLKPIDNAFLQAVLRLMQHMKDKSKIIFILYFVSNHSPEGADAVAAAYECYKFMKVNEQELYNHEKSKTREIVEKIRRKYPIVKTQHLLHLYNLADEKLFQLVEHPIELINALYYHESIMKQQKPDINKLAAELATLHNRDLSVIQMALLKKWLAFAPSPHAVEAALEETFYEDFVMADPDTSRGDGLSDEFVVRAHYILSSWSSEDAIELLISEMTSDGSSNNTGKQLQIFECFIKLIDGSTNPDLFELIQQDNFVTIKCVHYLKQLGYTLTQENFTGADKLVFLKRLWQQHANNGKGLELMAYICLGFEIYVPQIWNGILKQMVNLKMFKQLSSLVNLLSANKSLLHIQGLTLAWEYVIKEPFKSANRLKSIDQESILAKSFLLLQTCPVATSINLLELAENCIVLQRPHMAAIFIAYAKDEVKEKIIKMVNAHKSGSIKQDILELEEHGVIPVITNFVIHELKL